MQLLTLARYALRQIKNGTFTFDSIERKKEAIHQLKLISHESKIQDYNLDDPILEIHIGVYIPNFDYPIIQTDENNSPIIWQENNEYKINDKSSHIVSGIGLSGNSYYLAFLENLCPYRNSVVKVDRYTNIKRAAWALTNCVSKVLNKWELLKKVGIIPIRLEYELIEDEFNKKSDIIKEFESEQKKLYIKWLSKWISIHGKNPESHKKILKMENNKIHQKI